MDNSSLKTGTITGTLITILASISWAEIEKTLVLGAIGAAVSFLVSLFLKTMISYGKDLMGASPWRRRKA